MPPATLLLDLDGLGQAIRDSRQQLGLTQVQAAQLSGVSPRLWNETELGKRHQLGLDTAFRMLHTIGLDLLIGSRHSTPGARHARTSDASGNA